MDGIDEHEFSNGNERMKINARAKSVFLPIEKWISMAQ